MVWCSCTHAVDAERPRPPRRGATRAAATHRIAERVTEAALERLEPEFGDVRDCRRACRFDELRTNKPDRSEP